MATAQGTLKTWCLLSGGLLIQGHLTGNSVPWSWLQWSSGTGAVAAYPSGHLDRFYCTTRPRPAGAGPVGKVITGPTCDHQHMFTAKDMFSICQTQRMKDRYDRTS